MLCACSKDAATCEEAVPAADTETVEAPAPCNFAQMQQIVAETLGDDVAAGISPTSRYMRFIFTDVNTMLDAYMKGPIALSPLPLQGEIYPQLVTDEDLPQPMYALVESGTPLPEGAECEVLEEYFDPVSPHSGLTDQQSGEIQRVVTRHLSSTRAATVWKPSGHVEMCEDLTNAYLPIEGVRIYLSGYSSTGQLQVETVTTDSDGRYTSTKSYMGGVAEQVQFASAKWAVMQDNVNPAVIVCPTLMDNKAWNVIASNATTDRRPLYYATAFRAAYNMDTNGYVVSNGKGTSSFAIRCLNEPGTIDDPDTFYQDGSNKNAAILLIYCSGKSVLDIYNVVNRELGKAVHMLKINASTNNYGDFSKLVIDSWGEYTKQYFTDKEYGRQAMLPKIHTYSPAYTAVYGKVVEVPDYINCQDWCYITTMAPYSQTKTPMFIDISDDFNQGIWPGNFPGSAYIYPDDKFSSTQINGFTDLEAWSRSCINPGQLQGKCLEVVGPNRAKMAAINNLFVVYNQLEAAL